MGFFRLHLSSLKQMTSENRAGFLERLVWWEYQDQSKKIVYRIISKFKECNLNLNLLLLTNSDDAGVEDFVFIDHSLLDSQRSSILRNIEVLVLEYQHLSNSKKQKVGMEFDVLKLLKEKSKKLYGLIQNYNNLLNEKEDKLTFQAAFKMDIILLNDMYILGLKKWKNKETGYMHKLRK